MRLRNIKGADDAILKSPFAIKEPEKKKGNWRAVFENSNPIHIEVGMGKGQFITELALKNPDINYIGIEKFSSVLFRALEKRETVELDNLFFIRMDAEDICNVFNENEVARIYLNFSDPWPKDRHAKRRLTSKEFFKRFDHVLVPDGQIEFKTDNNDLFDFSLEEIPVAGWVISEFTRDLHNSPMCQGNIMTEYEKKFSSKGHSINKLIAKRP